MKNRLEIWLLWLILALIPLVISFAAAIAISPKYIVLHSGSLVLLLIWIFRSFGRPGFFTREPILWLWLAWVVWVAIMFGLAPYRWAGLHYTLNQLSYGLLFFLTIQIIQTEKQVRQTFLIIFLVFGVVSIYGILQHYGLSPFPWQRIPLQRPDSTFGNAVLFAGFLVVVMPLMIMLTVHKHIPANRVLYGVLVVAGLMALTLTKTRLAWLMVMLQITVLSGYLLHTRTPFKGVKLWSLVAATGTAVVACFGVILILFEDFRARFLELFDLQNVGYAERLHIWKAAWQMVIDKPITGHGAGMFQVLFPTYRAPDYPLHNFATIVPHAHNEFLEIWVNFGIVGLLIFVGLLGWTGFVLFRHFKTQTPFRRDMTMALALGLFGFIPLNLVNVNFQNVGVPAVFWVMAALGVILGRMGNPNKKKVEAVAPPSKKSKKTDKSPFRWLRFLIIPLIFAGAGWTGWFDGSYYLSQKQVHKGNVGLLQDEFRTASFHFQKATELYAYNAQIFYQLGYVLLKQGQVEPALNAFQKCNNLSPGFAETWFYMGECYRISGQFDEALAAYRKYDQHAHNGQGFFRYGALLMTRGQEREGRAVLQQAIEYLLREWHLADGGRREQIRSELRIAYDLIFKTASITQPPLLNFLENMTRLAQKLQPTPYLYLGRAYLRLERWPEAIEAFEVVNQLQPNDAMTLATLGHLYAETDQQPAQIVAYLQRAIELKPEFRTSVTPDLVKAYIALGEMDEAERRLSGFMDHAENVKDSLQQREAYLLELAVSYATADERRQNRAVTKLQNLVPNDSLLAVEMDQIEMRYRHIAPADSSQ